MGQCKRMGHFGGKTFLYQPRHWSITLQWNVKLEKILPHICISKSFVSFAYPVFHRFSLHSYLASFQTELTNTNAHFVFPYLTWFVKSLFHSKIFCSSPSVLGCSNCYQPLLLLTMSKDQFKLSGVFSLPARGAILSCQAAMNLQQSHTVCISWLFATLSFSTH